jgi:hypothetical protein
VYTGFWWENLRERDHWGDTGVDGRIILSESSGNGIWGCGLHPAGSGSEQVAGICKFGNEPS